MWAAAAAPAAGDDAEKVEAGLLYRTPRDGDDSAENDVTLSDDDIKVRQHQAAPAAAGDNEGKVASLEFSK